MTYSDVEDGPRPLSYFRISQIGFPYESLLPHASLIFTELLEFHYHHESPRALFSGSIATAPNMPPAHEELSPLPYIHQCRQLPMNISLRAKTTERDTRDRRNDFAKTQIVGHDIQEH